MNRFSKPFPKELPANVKLSEFKFGNVEKTVSQKNGTGYELKLWDKLRSLAKEKDYTALHNPTFSYTDLSGRHKLCVPDFLLLREKTCLILESKLRHTTDAYYQLANLYLPVVERWHNFDTIKCVEVCKRYDPSSWPEEFFILDNLEEIFSPLFHSTFMRYGVVEWRK